MQEAVTIPNAGCVASELDLELRIISSYTGLKLFLRGSGGGKQALKTRDP